MTGNKEKIIGGLDIGTTKICMVIGRVNEFGKLEVLSMAKNPSLGVMSGIVVNIEKTIAGVKKATKEAVEAAGVSPQLVNVGIAGDHIRSGVHHGYITRENAEELITADDLNRLTQDMYRICVDPGCKIIHVMPQDYSVDYRGGIKDPVGMLGRQIEADFNIITVQQNSITHIHKCVREAGLSVNDLILEPLASSLSVLSKDEKEAGVCLIDIGGGTTDMAIFYEGIIRHTAVIPLGGEVVTRDIQTGCGLLHEQAELLKIKFGRANGEEAPLHSVVSIPGIHDRPAKEIGFRKLACIIEARMIEIMEMVHREVIASGYIEKLSAGIVLTGGGAQLPDLGSLTSLVTGFEVRLGYPNEHLGRGRVEEIKSPMYATAVGLTLRGFMAIDEREPVYTSVEEDKGSIKNQQPGIFQHGINKLKDMLLGDYEDPTY